MKEEKQKEFIAGLENVYGPYNYESALFGSYNYSKVSAELCYSNSHFSKLISGGASEAMYDRAINNIRRLQTTKSLSAQLTKNPQIKKKPIWKFLAFGLGLAAVSLFFFMRESPDTTNSHPLEMYFDFNDAHYFKSPYLSEEQVHQYCPGSAYEGRWKLLNKYVIPIPYKIPGLYYVGSNADIRLKCKKTTTDNKGNELIGFENIENEIWFDKTMSKIDVNDISEGYIENLSNIDLENDQNFVKIASVYSCFYDEIMITNDSIYRKGEPCGRYANAENVDVLKKYNLDLNHIIEYIIGNMIFAKCAPVKNEYCDPNDLQKGESFLSFDCKCSLKGGGDSNTNTFNYTKKIGLIEQNYQSNLSCSCE